MLSFILSNLVELESLKDKLGPKIAATDTNSDNTHNWLSSVATERPASDLLRERFDGLLHGHYILLDLRLALLSSQLDMPDLPAFGGIHDITVEH